MARRVAVVLFNLGGPDTQEAVRPFLFNLFRDRAILGMPAVFRYPLAALITGLRTRLAKRNYAHMGGGSPLLAETRAQLEALQIELETKLADADVQVFTAMRYWKPFTAEVAREVAAWAPDDVVLLPLYPQYSTTTTGSSLQAWNEAYRGPGQSHAVCCYYAEAGFIDAHVRRIGEAWDAAGRPEDVKLLFSAHGLPLKVIKGGDPYQWQIEATCRAVAERLQWLWGWQVCYQSRVGPMKWLGPTTPEAIADASQEGLGVLIDPIAFVSEHVETLVELDRDYAEMAERLGCPVYLRAATVGVETDFIAGLARTVQKALGHPGLAPEGRACDAGLSGCPFHVHGKAA